MAIKIKFGSRYVVERGVYFERRNGEPTPIQQATFGNVLLIDTGSSGGYGVGAGINGETAQSKDSIYGFTDLESFRAYIRGGKHWDIGGALFKPSNNADGATKLYYVSAKKTTAPRMFHIFSGGAGGGALASATLKVVTANIISPGTNYAINDTITLAGGTFSTPCQITVTSVGLDGSITGATISQAGVYTIAPNGNATQNSTSGVGTGVTVSITFGLGSINLLLNGTGYLSPPTVRITGDGTGAVVTATLTGGSITSFTVVSAGDNFTAVPRLDIIAEDGDGGYLEVLVKTEGYAGNGVESAGKVVKGFGYKMFAGVQDPSKYIMRYYVGSFTGLDDDNQPYDNTAEVDTEPEIVAESIEFNDIKELIDWAKSDFYFNQFFQVGTNAIYGLGDIITPEDFANASLNNLASGGFESTSPQDFDDMLEAIKDLDIDFILTDKYGAISGGSQSIENSKLAYFVANDAKQMIQLIIPSGTTKNDLRNTYGALATAKLFDSEFVTVWHGGAYIQSPTGTGTKWKDDYYMAARALGLEAGVAPQTPITSLNIEVKKLTHNLTDKERVETLQGGVLFLVSEAQSFVIHQGVNSLQGKKNTQLINADGTSYEKSMFRIDGALQKEMRLQAISKKYAGGGNRNTASTESIKTFIENYLQSRVATDAQDNLIITYGGIKVTQEQDANMVEYQVVKNSPINKLLITSYSKFSL